MKGGQGRNIREIKDFSGGQVTRPPLKGLDTKFSVDCLNVYSEGLVLRRRNGYTVENATTTTGQGNGFYNWVKNATDQVQMTYFGSALSYITSSSGSWTGTLTSVSADSAQGTAPTNAYMHFVTFNGTLIFTTENRDKPQYMRVSDTSHFDIETGGAGSAPFAKYCQVWKNHAWLLNCGGGSELSEECSSLSSWTDNDVGTGVSTQTAFDGKSTFRLVGGGTSGDNARITRTGPLISNNYTFEIRNNFTTLGNITGGDYAEYNIANGVILFKARMSSSMGLEVSDGTNWNQVGTTLVSTGTWTTWKFLVTGGTASAAYVDIYQNGAPVGLQYSVMNASTASDGQIDIYARAGASGTVCDYYIDYMYINAVSAVSTYAQNGFMERYGPVNGSCASFSSASGSYLQLSDSTAFNFAADNFTLETLFNSASTSTAAVGLYTQGTPTSDQISWKILNNALVFSAVTGGTTIAYHSTAALTWNTAEWYALSIVRSSAGIAIYRDGQALSVSATTDLSSGSLPDLSTNIYIGAVAGTAGQFQGSLDEFRVSRSARYTSGYNVATSNFSSDSDTVLLLHLDSNFTDSSAVANSITTANSVATTTAGLAPLCWHASTTLTVAREGTTIKEGTYSIKLSGTGSFSQTISMPSGISGSSAYIGAWIKPPASGQYQFVVTDGSATYSSSVFSGASTAFEYRYFQFTTISSATNITVNLNVVSSNTFYLDHLAIIPAGTVSYSSDFSDRVQRSAIGLYNDWSGTDSGYNDVITPGDVGVTGSFILNDRMYVMKAWSIHRFSYTASFPLIDIKQVKKTVGTKSPRTVKNIDIPDVGEVVIFLGSDKRLYLFDGLTSTPVSDEMSTNNGLSSVYFDNINANALNAAWAVVHQHLNHYELFIPIGSNTTPTVSIVYDYVNKSFWPNDARTFTAGDVGDDGSGLRQAYALATSAGILAVLNSGNSDNTSAINSYWTSAKWGNALKLNRIDEIDVETPSQSAAPTITWRGGYEANYVATKSIASGTNSHTYAPGRIDNIIQIQIADNTTTAAWKVWAITLTERLLGVGK